MSNSFSLINLSSFFELFVAYTFAYNGLSSFKESLNKVSAKELDDKLTQYTKLSQDASLKAKDFGIVKESSDDLKVIIDEKLGLLNENVIKIERLNKVVNIIYSGDFLRPMFYLVGALYLLFIFLSAFQNYIGETSMVFAIGCLVISVWIFYLRYYFSTIRNYLQLKYEKIEWSFPTKKTLKIFFWVTFLGIILSVFISKNIHSNYPKWDKYFDKKMIDCIQLSRKDILYFFVVLGITSIAVIPYYIYYKRESFFEKAMEKENEILTKECNLLIRDIKVMSKDKGDLFN